MTDRSMGYVADVPYSFGYYPELSPSRIPLTFLLEGYAPPPVAVACELGFGQGISINVHAAAGPVRWYGTDFNPDQVAHAAGLAAASGVDVRLSDSSFAEYAARADLPQFDLITLHGVWSWVNAPNRAVLVDFIGKRLKLGGVVMISYNCKPAWAPLGPLRDLMVLHGETMSPPGDRREVKVERAAAFVEQLLALDPAYAKVNPHAADLLRRLHEQGPGYLAHEFFNGSWLPTSFVEMREALADARLGFVCAAAHLDRIDGLGLSQPQQALLAGIADRDLRETARDLITNAGFRRDYWVRGAVRLHPAERLGLLDQIRLVMVTPLREVSFTVNGALGTAQLNEAIYRPVLELMADHAPRSIAEIRHVPALRGYGHGPLIDILTMLIGKSDLMQVQPDGVIEAARGPTSRFNAHMLRQAFLRTGPNVLASPVTGMGLRLDAQSMLFTLAVSEGYGTPAEMAKYVRAWQGQTAVPVVDEVPAAAERFLADWLPMLRGLGIL